MYDFIVIGGGPAGASAAIAGARGGANVLLLERGRFPRHRVCGEFVSGESLDLLKRLLGPEHQALLRDAIRIPRARLFLDGHELEAAVNPPAASISRFDLDDALSASAARSGAEIREQTTVQGISGHGPFRVVTSQGEFECRAVIDASGRWSNLNASPHGNGKPREKWLGLKAHFAERSPEKSVDLYFFQGGYCGVQPVDLKDSDSAQERVNVCAMVRADVGSNFAKVFLQHPALRQRSLGWQPLISTVSTAPLIFAKPRPERDGVLLAGDAAGFVDPFVGDGISLALRSGWLAAQSLADFFRGELSHPQAVSRYRQTYERELAPVFRASSNIRRMLFLPRSVRKPLLVVLENTPAITRYLVSKTR